jgi:hypothetical protein
MRDYYETECSNCRFNSRGQKEKKEMKDNKMQARDWKKCPALSRGAIFSSGLAEPPVASGSDDFTAFLIRHRRSSCGLSERLDSAIQRVAAMRHGRGGRVLENISVGTVHGRDIKKRSIPIFRFSIIPI